jgi:hypothetical protein
MSSATALKVQFEWRQYKFGAEGSPEDVDDQFDKFLRFASDHEASDPPVRLNRTAVETGADRENDEYEEERAFPLPPASTVGLSEQNGRSHTSIAADIAADVFAKDAHGGMISLRVLPRTSAPETDALILLLFAHLTIDNRRSVSGAILAKGARQSGVRLDDRVVTFLEPYRDLVTRSGPPNGSVYSLTNPGIAHAKAILNDIWD